MGNFQIDWEDSSFFFLSAARTGWGFETKKNGGGWFFSLHRFYSSISSAMTVRIAITTGIHFPRLISFPSYLAMKRDKRHWRAVPQSHSTCFPRHGGILVKSPNRHSQQVSAMRSSSRPLRAVRTVPEQAVEASRWRDRHKAARLRCSNTWCRVRNICLFETPLQDGLFRRISDFPGGRGLMLSAR